MSIASILLLVVMAVVASLAAARLLRGRGRLRLLRELHQLADRQETMLRDLRSRLDAAHAEIAQIDDRADDSSGAAAIAAALREQLAHRLWLRDRAARAPLAELRSVRAAWRARARSLEQDSVALGDAQRALRQAHRSAIRPD